MPRPARATASTAYANKYRDVDFRKEPHKYRIGRGEQGVLMAEPYTSELGALWRFRTPEIARASAAALFRKFQQYKKEGDFVGMDMARKFLQMGFTRARRYANHPSGRKYAADGSVLPQAEDWGTSEKAEAARIFYSFYVRVREDETYRAYFDAHRAMERGRS